MRLKTLFISVVVLAVVSAVVYIARRPAPAKSQDPRVGQALLDGGTAEKAAKLQLSDAGKTITLARQPDGTWRNLSYHDLPADISKLSGFVGNLTDAKIERLVTSNPERIARLEFNDTKVELRDSADKPLWTVTLGKTGTSGGRFVRFGDENKAYLASLNAWLDTEPRNWANAQLLELKPEDIAKVEISFPAQTNADSSAPATGPGTVTLSRAKKDDAWKADPAPANQQVKADRIASLLTSIGSIRFSDTSELGDPNVTAAKANQRVFKLTTFDGKTYTVAMGRKPEEKRLKPPAPTTDGKTGPAPLGSITDLAKKDEKASDDAAKDGENKPVAPEFETIPAGPVYVFITAGDASAPVNAMMQKRAFQIPEYTFTGLPQKPDELFEPAPAPAEKSKG